MKTVEQYFFDEWKVLLQQDIQKYTEFLTNGYAASFDEYQLYVGKLSELRKIIEQTEDLYNKFYNA